MDVVRSFHIELAIPAGAEPACRAFWAGALQFDEIPKPDPLAARGGCWFQAGDIFVLLGVEADFRPSLVAGPTFAVRSLDDVWRQLAAYDPTAPCTLDDAPLRGFSVHDPVGNRLDFRELEAATPRELRHPSGTGGGVSS